MFIIAMISTTLVSGFVSSIVSFVAIYYGNGKKLTTGNMFATLDMMKFVKMAGITMFFSGL